MTPHPVPPLLGRTARTRRVATAAALVLLTIATRWLAAPFQRGSYEYQFAGLLDTCVKPWQFFTGHAVAGGDNCYLSFAMSYVASGAFGYSVEVLQAVQIAATATCYGIVFLALERMLGWASALRTVVLLIVTLPFISHSVLPTNMRTALWGSAAWP
jgi:thiosulfate reductase cytochrome b subunit